MVIGNMLMIYDEIRDRLIALGILSAAQIEDQQRLLRALKPESLPAAWGNHRVAADA